MENLIPSGLLTTIQLLGAGQGVLLAGILLRSPANKAANRILGLVMLVFTLDLLAAWYLASGLESDYPHFLGVDFLTPFLYGPLVYTYARSVTTGGAKLPADTRWHFAPLAVLILLALPFYLQSGPEKLAFRADPGASPWTPWLTGLNFVKLGYGLAYLALTFRVLRRHKETIRDWYASDDRVALDWLRNMLSGGILVWSLSFVLFIAWAYAGDNDPLEGYDDLVSIGLAVFVYTIGYLGLAQRQVQVSAKQPATAPRYERTGLTAEEASQIRTALARAMEDEAVYRQSDLTLPSLSAHLGVSPHKLSEVLNSHEGRSFYDYVNARRVEDFKARLAGPGSGGLTLLGHAMDAGFPSKSSFNSVFKRLEGKTPSQYRRELEAAE